MPQAGSRIALPSIGARELLAGPPSVVVDLRSPAEFAEDHVPGAVNVPLFDDVQRALVGTLYVQSSPRHAFDEARGIVRGRIRELVAGIAAAADWTPPADDLEQRADELMSPGFERLSSELLGAEDAPAPARPVVLHCWRGGLRSRSVAHFVRELGLERATLLEGGWKAYRAEVVRQLATMELPPLVVLRGLTGVGKTLMLRELERERPECVLDLEALAGHRSSLLGMVGLAPCSQKTFESRLAARLRAPLGDVLVVEGESRKVGDVVLPPRLWQAMQRGTNVELVAGVEERVRILSEDYLATEQSRAELRVQLPLVQARMPGATTRPPLVQLLDEGRTDELVRILLEHYYDPLYRHSERGRVCAARIRDLDELCAFLPGA